MGSLASGSRDRYNGMESVGPGSLPPKYIDVVDMIERDEQEMSCAVKKLKHLHSQRLKVTFQEEDHHAQDREINLLSSQIQTLLSRSEKNLKKIASVGNDGRISTQDRICRLNIMRSYARRLQLISRNFKTSQRNFIRSLKGQSEIGRDLIWDDEETTEGFSRREEKMRLMEEEAKAKEAEIDQLVESIAAISALFKELSVLVIDQGSLLDRIDYNIENIQIKTIEGRQQMEKANEYSKNNRSLMCIVVLTAMMFVLLFLVYLKYS